MSRRSNKTRAAKRTHKPAFELLETRALLAGNISVDVSGGNLIVRGDNQANGVAILQLDDGAYAVVGFNGTRVEGSADPFVVEGVTGNIDVDLKKGDDLIGVGNDPAGLILLAQEFGFGDDLGDAQALQDDLLALLDDAGAPERLEVPRNLNIRAGDGRDGVGIAGDIGQAVIVNLGNGDNTLVVVDSTVGGSLVAIGGKARDTLFVANTQIDHAFVANLKAGRNIADVANSSIGHSAVVTTGKHVDIVDFADTSIGHSLIVRTGSGDDDVRAHAHDGEGVDINGNVNIDTGSHRDYVELTGVVDGNVNIRTGNHDDEVFLSGLAVHNSLIVNLGSGNDDLEADGVEVDQNAVVVAGSGNDAVALSASNVDRVFTAIMGSGRDTLFIQGSTASKAVLLGGSSRDTLRFDDEELEEIATIKQFEDVELIVEEEEEEQLG
ncbi:MAG: hypothetical protein WD872_13770 [Pirellulaceae bacterium]